MKAPEWAKNRADFLARARREPVFVIWDHESWGIFGAAYLDQRGIPLEQAVYKAEPRAVRS